MHIEGRLNDYYAVAGRPGGSVGNLETFSRWDMSSNLDVVTRTGVFPHKINKIKIK